MLALIQSFKDFEFVTVKRKKKNKKNNTNVY